MSNGTKGFRQTIFEQQGDRCALCGELFGEAGKARTLHHIIFKSEDGELSLENIVGLCLSCHARCHRDHTAESPQFKEEMFLLTKIFHKKKGSPDMYPEKFCIFCHANLQSSPGIIHPFFAYFRDQEVLSLVEKHKNHVPSLTLEHKDPLSLQVAVLVFACRKCDQLLQHTPVHILSTVYEKIIPHIIILFSKQSSALEKVEALRKIQNALTDLLTLAEILWQSQRKKPHRKRKKCH